jgi:DNA-directed RNA polymerase specialized sigma24 family protein
MSSSAYAEQLAAVWPEVRVRLHRYLASQRVQHDLAEDIVQEVALRALRGEVHFEQADDLLPWCITVARRLKVDHHRRAARLVGPVDEALPDVIDVSDAAVARMRLRSLPAAFRRLSVADRTALVERPTPGADRREITRLAVRRHRARGRLARLLPGAVGLAGLRSWLRSHRVAGATLVAAVLVVPLLPPVATPSFGDGGRHGPARLVEISSGSGRRQDRSHKPLQRSASRQRPQRVDARPASAAASTAPSPNAPQSQEDTRRVIARVDAPVKGTYTATYVDETKPDDHFVCLKNTDLGDQCWDPPATAEVPESAPGPAPIHPKDFP